MAGPAKVRAVHGRAARPARPWRRRVGPQVHGWADQFAADGLLIGGFLWMVNRGLVNRLRAGSPGVYPNRTTRTGRYGWKAAVVMIKLIEFRSWGLKG